MLHRTVSPQDLSRLKREREIADRAYNDALTSLDAAVRQPPEASVTSTECDEPDCDTLARLASVFPAVAVEGEPRWRTWLRRLVAPIVGPALDNQKALNGALIEHVRHSAEMRQEDRRHRHATTDLLRSHLVAAATFRSRAVQFAQQITPYVDTKDREVAGLARRVSEDNGVRIDGLAAALDLVAGTNRTLNESVGVLQTATLVVKRELERTRRAPAERGGAEPPPAEAGDGASDLHAYKYAGFEDAFRGRRADIEAQQRSYLTYFEGASDVLDVGCGRGEFLELLRAGQIQGRGIDVNAEMVARCRERGLDATSADALAYLEALPDASLGGVIAAQVVEHLPATYLIRLLEVAHHKLRPGAHIVLETINPACWMAFFSAYLRDITHVHPLHADTLGYLLRASGFVDVETIFSSPHPEASKLQSVPLGGARNVVSDDETLELLVERFNANVKKLNGLIFAEQDYAAVATRY